MNSASDGIRHNSRFDFNFTVVSYFYKLEGLFKVGYTEVATVKLLFVKFMS